MSKRKMRWFGRVLSGVLTVCLMFSGFSVGQLIVSAAELAGYRDEAVVRFKNVGSGKYLNVHYGNDSNNTNVYQWSDDGSVEQTFRLRYNVEEDCYLIGAMCSSDGGGRVLDVVKTGGQVQAGCNVQIYDATDPIAQQWQFSYQGNGRFTIFPVSSIYTVLTANGDSNGSGNGTSSSSAGNVYLSAIPMASYVSYTSYQLWEVEELNSQRTLSNGVYNITNDNNRRMAVNLTDWNVIQKNRATVKEQIWRVEYIWCGYYCIRPVFEREKVLSIPADLGDIEGTNVSAGQEYNNHSPLTLNSLWKIVPNADGGYRIASKASFDNQVISVLYSDEADGTNIVQLPYYSAPGQRWTFARASCPGGSNSHIEDHILEFFESDRRYRCAVCGATFLAPQEEDYTLLLEEDLLSVFALQRAARMLELTQTKSKYVEACYKMTDIIRNKSIYEGTQEYEYVNSDGECLSSFPYTCSGNTIDTYISVYTQEIDLANIIGRDLFWSADELLPFPCNLLGEWFQDEIRIAMEEPSEAVGCSTSEVYAYALERMLKDTEEGKMISKISNIISVIDFAKAYITAAAEREYRVGDICVQVNLNNGTSYDTYIGYYRIEELGSQKRICVIDEVMDTEDWDSTPPKNTYRYEHYSTLPGDTSMRVERGTLF